jgi:hypothetical protein
MNLSTKPLSATAPEIPRKPTNDRKIRSYHNGNRPVKDIIKVFDN